MCAQRLAWLEQVLDERGQAPSVIFMHHPPFTTGIEAMDRIGLDGAQEMAAIVARHSQIERVLCGHLHRPIQVRWAGTIAQTATPRRARTCPAKAGAVRHYSNLCYPE